MSRSAATRARDRAVIALAPTAAAAKLSRRVLRDALIAAGRTRLVQAHTGRLFALFREPVIRQRPLIQEALAARPDVTDRS